MYSCNVIQRTESIPISTKTMNIKKESRQFEFHKSVFAGWRKETPAKIKESIETDCSLWKLKKFIKDEDEIKACRDLVEKHQQFLKDLFLNMVSQSSYPAITTLDFGAMAVKTKIVDEKFAQLNVDRSFVAANFQMPENPKF